MDPSRQDGSIAAPPFAQAADLGVSDVQTTDGVNKDNAIDPEIPTEKLCGPTLGPARYAGVKLGKENSPQLVDSKAALGKAIKNAKPGDVILLKNKVWNNLEIDFYVKGEASAPIVLRAETPGQVTLENPHIIITGHYAIVDGLILRPGQATPITFRTAGRTCTHCRVTNTLFLAGPGASSAPEEGIWIDLFGRLNRVDHCFFRGGEKGAYASVWLRSEDGQPKHHRVDHNYFGERPKPTPAYDGEQIIVGSGPVAQGNTYVHATLHSLIDRNYFCAADREREVISVKSSNNLIWLNTIDTSQGGITLRQGEDNRIDSNLFVGQGIDHSSGIVVMGARHVIVNNTFSGLTSWGIDIRRGANTINPDKGWLDVQPVEDITIAFNTLVDCTSSIQFAGQHTPHWGPQHGITFDVPARGVRLINNLVYSFRSELVTEVKPAAQTQYAGNLFYGEELGIPQPAGLELIDPQVVSDGAFYRPAPGSPALDRAADAFELAYDMEGHCRHDPADVGADEQQANSNSRRPVTFADVGPLTIDTAFVYQGSAKPGCLLF